MGRHPHELEYYDDGDGGSGVQDSKDKDSCNGAVEDAFDPDSPPRQ